jgi:hypothetical protein
MLRDSSMHCRNGSSPLVLSQELASAAASSKVPIYNYLEIPSCLREKGVERFKAFQLDQKFRQAIIELASAR